MSQIEELQRRITSALDRIGQGLDGLSGGGDGGAGELAALRTELEEEKLANAQLQERLKSIREKHEANAEASEKAQAKQATAMKKLDSDLQSVRKANQQLRDNNQLLREANEAGVAEPHLINKAMLAELEGLRAARATDRSEANAVLADLEQLIAGASDADDATTQTEDA